MICDTTRRGYSITRKGHESMGRTPEDHSPPSATARHTWQHPVTSGASSHADVVERRYTCFSQSSTLVRRDKLHTLTLQIRRGLRVGVSVASSGTSGERSHTGFWEATSLPTELNEPRHGLQQPLKLWATPLTPGNFRRQEATQFTKS